LPPTEPWEFDQTFQDTFRKCVEFRYRLMPYIWAQAAEASAKGHPMLRPLFFEFPQDPGSWAVEDEYLFGSDLLVAPLFEEVKERALYLPPGEWVDLQSGQTYQGPGWVTVKAGEMPVVVLGRGGAAIPTLQPALHTGAQDWGKMELWVLGRGNSAKGAYCPKDSSHAEAFEIGLGAAAPSFKSDPGKGKVAWSFKRLGAA
jgi:alpha-D-xyloside xylohydrolase